VVCRPPFLYFADHHLLKPKFHFHITRKGTVSLDGELYAQTLLN